MVILPCSDISNKGGGVRFSLIYSRDPRLGAAISKSMGPLLFGRETEKTVLEGERGDPLVQRGGGWAQCMTTKC